AVGHVRVVEDVQAVVKIDKAGGFQRREKDGGENDKDGEKKEEVTALFGRARAQFGDAGHGIHFTECKSAAPVRPRSRTDWPVAELHAACPYQVPCGPGSSAFAFRQRALRV